MHGDSLVIVIPKDIKEHYKFVNDEWVDVPFNEFIRLKRVKVNNVKS